MLLLKMLCSTDTHTRTRASFPAKSRDPIWSFLCCLRPFLLSLPTQPWGTKQQQQWENVHHCEKSVFSSHSSWACALSVCEWAKHYFSDRNFPSFFRPKLSHCWEEKRSFHSQRVAVCVGVEKQGGKEKRKRRKTPTQRQCESARQRSRTVKSRGGRKGEEEESLLWMDLITPQTMKSFLTLLFFVSFNKLCLWGCEEDSNAQNKLKITDDFHKKSHSSISGRVSGLVGARGTNSTRLQ